MSPLGENFTWTCTQDSASQARNSPQETGKLDIYTNYIFLFLKRSAESCQHHHLMQRQLSDLCGPGNLNLIWDFPNSKAASDFLLSRLKAESKDKEL